MSYCWLNGETLQYKDCHLHISDLLIQRGYGVFDFFRCRDGHIPWLEDYTDRLYKSMQLSGIEEPLSREEFTSLIYDLKEKNESVNDAFKVIVTGGYSDTLDSITGSANMIILSVPWKAPSTESFTQGVNLISDEYQRPNPEVKTLYYYNSMRLSKKMKEYNAIDVLYYTNKIAETSRASVFLVQGGEIYTPASDILHGITRKRLLSFNGEIRVQDLPAKQLLECDEMFITSTSRNITPIVALDGKKIGDGKPGKITRELITGFKV